MLDTTVIKDKFSYVKRFTAAIVSGAKGRRAFVYMRVGSCTGARVAGSCDLHTVLLPLQVVVQIN